MITFVLFTLWCHGPLSPFLPAAYEPILIAYAQLFSPPLLAIVGALAATAVELPNYLIYRRLLLCRWMQRLRSAPQTRRVSALFSRRPFLALWILIWSPLPDWGARVLAANSGYPVKRYLAAVLLARRPRFRLLAVLGFHLGFGAEGAIAIIAVSIAFALAGTILRAVRGPRAPVRAATVTAVALIGLSVPRLQAQTERLPDGPALGMTLDRFSQEDGFSAMAISFRMSALRAGSAGTEIGVGVFPQALYAGALLLAPNVGASYNISLPNATILARGGLSTLTVLGGGFLFLPGAHVGGGVIVRVEERLALRLDVNRHFYQFEGETIGMWSVGVGFAVLPWRPIIYSR